jgi:hypothetical protein
MPHRGYGNAVRKKKKMGHNGQLDLLTLNFEQVFAQSLMAQLQVHLSATWWVTNSK